MSQTADHGPDEWNIGVMEDVVKMFSNAQFLNPGSGCRCYPRPKSSPYRMPLEKKNKTKWGREPKTFCQGYSRSDSIADDLIEDS